MLPSKATLLALAVSLDMDRNQIQILLRKAGYILSHSLPNDVIVMWLLDNMTVSSNRLSIINDTLYELDLPLLMTRDKKNKTN